MDPVETISSTKNPLVRRLRDAAAGEPADLVLAEGIKLVNEGLDAGLAVAEVVYTERLGTSELGRAVQARLERAADRMFRLAPSVMERVSSVKSPPGVIAVFRRPAPALGELLGATDGTPLLVLSAGLRDPGNLGALVRTSEAAGATGLGALRGGADPWREKAVRGSAGSVFRLPTLGGLDPEPVAQLCADRGLQVVLADGASEQSYLDVDFKKPTAVLMGAEADGVPEELLASAPWPDLRPVHIPMAHPVESLNVSVAAGVLLFEARRQRT